MLWVIVVVAAPANWRVPPLTVRVFASDPRDRALVTDRTPELRTTPPEKVFVPDRVTVPTLAAPGVVAMTTGAPEAAFEERTPVSVIPLPPDPVNVSPVAV